MNFLRKNIFAIFIFFILALIPFFWLKPGELELGGDSSRLYLYNPLAYIHSDVLYSITPEGFGPVRPDQNALPFFLMLEGIYLIFHSPFVLISSLNGLLLAGSFIFIYLIVCELLQPYVIVKNGKIIKLSAILAGFFYAISPSVGKPMMFALLTHNQVFLNPMIFYLMLRFLKTENWKYMWFLLLATVLFSPNFSPKAPPPPFSFFPLAFLFLGLYITLFLHKKLPWKKLGISFIFFVCLHAFHIIPVAIYTFDTSSLYNIRVFDAKAIIQQGINYFYGVLQYAMVTRSFFYTYDLSYTQWSLFVVPLTTIFGFILINKRTKDFLLIAIFFLITTFLESANILNFGVFLYGLLFYIPGFSMFRNFYGQWQWVQDFFYSLLFGYSIFLVFSKLKKYIVVTIFVIIICLFVFSSWLFLSGGILKVPLRTTDNVSPIITMDPNYIKSLSSITHLPLDGKIIDMPFNEFDYQVVPGLNRGAYIGPSPIAYLTGRKDFDGEQIFEPFSLRFLSLIKDKNYEAIKRLFGLANIKYIFYNSDPRDYDEYFPSIQYSLLMPILPTTKSVTSFVKQVSNGEVFHHGSYALYTYDEKYYLPHFFVPTKIYTYNAKEPSEATSFFIKTNRDDPRIGYLDRSLCINKLRDMCNNQNGQFASIPSIIFQKINPTKYKVEISGVTKPFFLIFSEQFDTSWKAFISQKEEVNGKAVAKYFNQKIIEKNQKDIFLDKNTLETLGMKTVSDKQHIIINGYANAWYIRPSDIGNKTHFTLIVEMTQQRIFYFALGVSIVSFIIFIIVGLKLFFQRNNIVI